tara:strand:+ start:308 stop:802 length:495 start_codon:yes stop_codon:yes gene_type:complete
MQNKNIETPSEIFIPTWVTSMGSEKWSKLKKNAPASYVSKIKNAMNDALSPAGWNRIGEMVSRYVPEAVFADPVYDAHIKAWRRHLRTVKAKATKPHAKKLHKGQNKPKAHNSVATDLFNQASNKSQQPVVSKPKKRRVRKNPGARRNVILIDPEEYVEQQCSP